MHKALQGGYEDVGGALLHVSHDLLLTRIQQHLICCFESIREYSLTNGIKVYNHMVYLYYFNCKDLYT